jgi:hypothetical protein
MRPISMALVLAAADDDGICQSQTRASAGALTINGALATGGVATLAAGIIERQVLITATGNESGITFTIAGTNSRGQSISETVAGPNATTGTTASYFQTVTSVTVSDSMADVAIVGTNEVGGTVVAIPDYLITPFAIGIGVKVSGTITYTVQHTFDDALIDSFRQGAATWINHSVLAAKTTTLDSNYAFPVRGIRLTQSAGTGTATLALVQAGW